MAAGILGIDILSDQDKTDLENWGFDLKVIESDFPSFYQAFYWGKLSELITDYNAKKIEYSDFKMHLERGQYLPMTKVETYALNVAKHRTYSHITGLGEGIKKDIQNTIAQTELGRRDTYEKIIAGELEKGVEDRKSIKRIISEIGHKTGDWDRNIGRIVDTEMNNIFQEGRAQAIRDKEGADAKVYKDVYPGACFPIKDTQYLTSEGFKYLDEITGNEKVLSFNLKTNTAEWTNIVSIIRYQYSGEMHWYKNTVMDLLSTPNHFHLVGKCKYKNHKPTYSNVLMQSSSVSDKLPYRDIMYLSVDNWKMNTDDYIEFCGKTFKTEFFAKFMGWYLSEGSISLRKKRIQGGSNMTQVSVSQTKEHNFKNIQESFSGMFPDRNIIRNSEKFVCNLDMSYDQFAQWLKNLGTSITFSIPKEIKELDKKYLLMFLDTFTKGDGNISKITLGKRKRDIGGKTSLYTSSKKMADDLVEIVIKCGFSSSISVRDSIGVTTYKKNGSPVTTRHLRYIVSINKNKYVKNIKNYFNVLNDWSGEVGCLELSDNFTLLIRRSGKHIWTGNCRHCIAAYLTNGIGSQPKIFKLSELQENGTNIGKKVNDWKPTIYGLHPFCRCTLHKLLPGQVWDDEKGEFTFKVSGESVKSKLGLKSKIIIRINDKIIEV